MRSGRLPPAAVGELIVRSACLTREFFEVYGAESECKFWLEPNWIRFEDGVEGGVDLSHPAGQGVFSVWRDRHRLNPAVP
jgi:hypothetical protein